MRSRSERADQVPGGGVGWTGWHLGGRQPDAGHDAADEGTGPRSARRTFVGTPVADMAMRGDSRFLNDGVDDVLVSCEGLTRTGLHEYLGNMSVDDPRVSPIFGDFTGFPPSLPRHRHRDLFLATRCRRTASSATPASRPTSTYTRASPTAVSSVLFNCKPSPTTASPAPSCLDRPRRGEVNPPIWLATRRWSFLPVALLIERRAVKELDCRPADRQVYGR